MISMDDLCNADKVFEKLDKTFLPKNYQRAVLEWFRSMKFKTGNKLSEFYEDMKVAYNKSQATCGQGDHGRRYNVISL